MASTLHRSKAVMGLTVRRVGAVLVVLALAAGWAAAETRVELRLPDLDGRMHDIAQHRGKWVVINYWATWCPPCIHEIPELAAFHSRHADDDAVVVGVNIESLDDATLRDFVEELGVNYPILREDPERVSPLGRLFGLPTSYIVGPDGRLVTRHNGPVTAAQLEALIGASGAESASRGPTRI